MDRRIRKFWVFCLFLDVKFEEKWSSFGVQQLSLSSFVVFHLHLYIQNLQYTVFFWQFSVFFKKKFELTLFICLFICLRYQVRRDLRLLQSSKLEEIVGSCFHVITGRKPRQKVHLLERYIVLLFQIFSCSLWIQLCKLTLCQDVNHTIHREENYFKALQKEDGDLCYAFLYCRQCFVQESKILMIKFVMLFWIQFVYDIERCLILATFEIIIVL